jgi:deoxyribonuclease-4
MKKVKFGLKLWSTNKDTMPQAEDLINRGLFNYIELTPIPGTEITPFLSFNLPYIVHITTEHYGLNIADRNKRDLNLKTIENCILWADKLEAKYLILHPGYDGSIDYAINFLDEIQDKRILIENMPKIGITNESMLGYSPKQIKQLRGCKFGFCLDLNHAIKAAVSLKLDYKTYIRDFLKFNPDVFHISDGCLSHGKDEHLAPGEGEYDFKFLIQCVSSTPSKCVTLETPRNNLMSFEEDLNHLRKIKVFID